MQKFRVLFVAGADFFSGAERALLLTAQGLLEAGHHPVVAVANDGELLTQLRRNRVPAEHIPLAFTSLSTLHRCLPAIARLAGLARRHQVDLVHANEAPSFQLAGYAARVRGIPAVTHIRFPEGAAGYAWYLKSGFAKALFVSEYLRRDMVALAPAVFANRAEVVYDGVQLPRPHDEAGRLALRAEFQIPDDRPSVVIAGQVVEVKGIWEYLEAARLLCEADVRATFVVLGDDLKNQGETRRQVEARVDAMGLREHFRFLGFRADAPALIPLFDIVAVPSHIEPLGNATLEAMAAGRPVVGSRVGGIPEMVVEEETGLLVPPQDAPALAHALGRLIADPGLARRFGDAGLVRAQQVFSVPAHVARLTALYETVTERAAAGSPR